jgi:hypothetical protein
MLTCEVGSAPDPSKTNVLDLMTGRAQRDHANQALDTRRFVVLPNLMALDRVPEASPATNLAATVCIPIDLSADPIPIPRRHLISHV